MTKTSSKSPKRKASEAFESPSPSNGTNLTVEEDMGPRPAKRRASARNLSPIDWTTHDAPFDLNTVQAPAVTNAAIEPVSTEALLLGDLYNAETTPAEETLDEMDITLDEFDDELLPLVDTEERRPRIRFFIRNPDSEVQSPTSNFAESSTRRAPTPYKEEDDHVQSSGKVEYEFYKEFQSPFTLRVFVGAFFNDEEIGRAAGTLIDRESIRGDFYRNMEKAKRPTSDRIAQLLDKNGGMQLIMVMYYDQEAQYGWNQALDEGPMLQLDGISVHKAWQKKGIGKSVFIELVEKVRKLEPRLNLVYAVPGADRLWTKGEINVATSYFLQTLEFVKIRETGWFILDVSPEEEYPAIAELRPIVRRPPYPEDVQNYSSLVD